MMTSHLCAASVLRTKPGPADTRVGQPLPELVGEKLGDLVLEALALLGRERHVVRVGTDSERLGVDQFERRLGTLQRLREDGARTKVRQRAAAQTASCQRTRADGRRNDAIAS
jgi:hypothetical protein